MVVCDVAVLGSGPAGATAAQLLAGAGLKTVIIEKETLPRYKTCGGGVVRRARDLLPYAIDPVVARDFHTATIGLGVGQPLLSVRRDRPVISRTMRDDLDAFMTGEALRAGASLLDGRRLVGISTGTVLGLQTTGERVRANFLVAADGAYSPVAKLLGWADDRHLIPALEYEVRVVDRDFAALCDTARFDIGAVPHGYGWLFPKQDHLSIGVLSTRRGRGRLPEYYRRYLDYLGIRKVLGEDKHGFQIPLTPRGSGCAAGNVLLAGDAAGFADPVVAEGISSAILSGQLAARAIIGASADPAQAGVRYQRAIDTELMPRLKVAQTLAGFLYHYPRARTLLFRKYGERLGEMLTDVFMGERHYPDLSPGQLKSRILSRLRPGLFRG